MRRVVDPTTKFFRRKRPILELEGNVRHQSTKPSTNNQKEEIKLFKSYNISTNISKEFVVPITVADVHLRHEQLPFAYFYEKDFDMQRLKQSFAKLLTNFPTAGGTLQNYQHILCTKNDTVPLTFANASMTMQEWLQESRGHLHQSGNGHHPSLLPIFDPLFHSAIDSDNDNDGSTENLMSVKVTQFANDSGFVVAINMNHLLGDTASCIRFAQCFGLEYSGDSSYGKPCLDRSKLSSTGMMCPKVADILDVETNSDQDTRTATSWLQSIFGTEETKASPVIDHEYVTLSFSSDVLDAMKAHGMERTDSKEHEHSIPSYISRNDTIMAATWLLKKVLSEESDTNLSIVMNLRGRCGIEDFHCIKNDIDFSESKSGLFGNGIVNVFAEFEPSTVNASATTDTIPINDVSDAAIAIRAALIEGAGEISYRLQQSKAGTPTQSRTKPEHRHRSNCFSITSWRQLSPKDVSFSDKSSLVDFHGQPSHPIPNGETYTSVVHDALDSNGASVELFLPSSQKENAITLHEEICSLFLKWHETTTQEKGEKVELLMR